MKPWLLLCALALVIACAEETGPPVFGGERQIFDAGGAFPPTTSGTAPAPRDAAVAVPMDAGAPFDAPVPFDGPAPFDGPVPDALYVDGAPVPPPPPPDAATPRAVGEACSVDDDCASGRCFRLADERPECSGAVCTVTCDTTTACQQAAEAAGAPRPGGAFCNTDGECNLVGTGLGAFVCN